MMEKEDKDLEVIFSGEERPLHPDTVHVSLTGKPREKKVEEVKEAKDGKWEPVKENTWMDGLRDCAKWVIGFGGLTFLLFYWNEAGLMAESIAIPSMLFTACLTGLGVGKVVKR